MLLFDSAKIVEQEVGPKKCELEQAVTGSLQHQSCCVKSQTYVCTLVSLNLVE